MFLLDLFKKTRVKKSEKQFILFSLILICISAFMDIKAPLGSLIIFMSIFWMLFFITSKKIERCSNFIRTETSKTPDRFLSYLRRRLDFYQFAPFIVFLPGIILSLIPVLILLLEGVIVDRFSFSMVLIHLMGSIIVLKGLFLVIDYEDLLKKYYDYKK